MHGGIRPYYKPPRPQKCQKKTNSTFLSHSDNDDCDEGDSDDGNDDDAARVYEDNDYLWAIICFLSPTHAECPGLSAAVSFLRITA